jgi:hypothetical protein
MMGTKEDTMEATTVPILSLPKTTLNRLGSNTCSWYNADKAICNCQKWGRMWRGEREEGRGERGEGRGERLDRGNSNQHKK